MCPVERERDPSGCRVSGQTPELGYRSTLCWLRRCWFRRCWFCRCWFRRCFVFMHSFRRCFVFRRRYRWCNVNRIVFDIFWIVLGSFVFASCGGYKKLGILARAGGHGNVQSTLLLSYFLQHRRHRPTTPAFIRRLILYITMKLNKSYKTHFNCSGHN